MEVDQDVNTKASRVLAAGGAGLPESALHLAHQYEVTQRAIADDPTLSDTYKRQRLAEIKVATVTAMRAERDKAVAAAEAELAKREAAVLGEIRGKSRERSASVELDNERAERQHRTTLDAFSLLTSQLALQATNDPSALLDAFEEALESGRRDRVRAIEPIVRRNLELAKRAKRPGAEDALAAVSGRWMQFTKQHPAPMAQLRAIRADKHHVAAVTSSAYAKAEDYFALGATHGARI